MCYTHPDLVRLRSENSVCFLSPVFVLYLLCMYYLLCGDDLEGNQYYDNTHIQIHVL